MKFVGIYASSTTCSNQCLDRLRTRLHAFEEILRTEGTQRPHHRLAPLIRTEPHLSSRHPRVCSGVPPVKPYISLTQRKHAEPVTPRSHRSGQHSATSRIDRSGRISPSSCALHSLVRNSGVAASVSSVSPTSSKTTVG
jgi:hypothetical protein